jgi:hypothetical protein
MNASPDSPQRELEANIAVAAVVFTVLGGSALAIALLPAFSERLQYADHWFVVALCAAFLSGFAHHVYRKILCPLLRAYEYRRKLLQSDPFGSNGLHST